MNGQQLVVCGKCGSNRVAKNKVIRNVVIVALLISWIPIIGWINAPLMLLVALVAWVINKSKKIEPMKCMECKNKFQISEKVYKEFNAL